MGGFIKSYKTENFKVFIDFFYQEDNKKLPAGPDALSQGVLSYDINGDGVLDYDNYNLSQSGDAPLWIKDYSLSLNMEYKDFSLKARLFEHSEGSAYGINLALPQSGDRVKRPNHYLEIGYKKELNDYQVDIKAGIKQDAFDSKSKLLPDGLNIGVVFEDGVYGEHLATQRTLYQSSYLRYDGINNHTITTGYRFTKEETIEMVSKLSSRTTGDVELVDYTQTLPFFDADAKRNTFVFSLQDEYHVNSRLSLIYGFNYESTSYKDAGFEPRVSMVYQTDTQNIFKAMYSRAHRNASWQEMFTMNNRSRVGSTDLDPESVDAFEVAYIKKISSDTHLQTNLFYLLNKDQIYNTSTDPQYRNVVDTDIYGFELEYKGNLTSLDQLYFNYSYIDGDSHIKDENKYESLSNIAHHLAKAYYIYNLNTSLSLSGVAKYIGSKERVSGDSRGKVEAYSTLDTALKYENKKYNYSLALSVKNIFDTRVTYPSPPNTYSQDYEQERRNFLVALTKEF
jgi:iron complex outermembrane receptor protein